MYWLSECVSEHYNRRGWFIGDSLVLNLVISTPACYQEFHFSILPFRYLYQFLCLAQLSVTSRQRWFQNPRNYFSDKSKCWVTFLIFKGRTQFSALMRNASQGLSHIQKFVLWHGAKTDWKVLHFICLSHMCDYNLQNEERLKVEGRLSSSSTIPHTSLYLSQAFI